MANSATTAKIGVFPDSNGFTVSELTPTELTAKYSGSTLKTPSQNFAMPYNGIILNCRSGIPIMCDAALLAAFTASSAPVV